MLSITGRLALVALLVFGVGGVAADAASFTATTTGLDSLDHNYAYAWRVGGLDVGTGRVTSASIAFNGLRNWDSNANTLYVWLFDSARSSGVRSTWDGEAGMIDFFAGPLSTARLSLLRERRDVHHGDAGRARARVDGPARVRPPRPGRAPAASALMAWLEFRQP